MRRDAQEIDLSQLGLLQTRAMSCYLSESWPGIKTRRDQFIQTSRTNCSSAWPLPRPLLSGVADKQEGLFTELRTERMCWKAGVQRSVQLHTKCTNFILLFSSFIHSLCWRFTDFQAAFCRLCAQWKIFSLTVEKWTVWKKKQQVAFLMKRNKLSEIYSKILLICVVLSIKVLSGRIQTVFYGDKLEP